MSDPFDLLSRHVRGRAEALEPGTSTDELISHITLEYHRGSAWSAAPAARRRRRWSSLVVSAAVFVGLGAGAVVTATILDRQTVEHPRLGIVCRASADGRRVGLALPPSPDPIATCAQLWATGQLPKIDEISPPTTPALVACVGRGGAIEVYPGESDEVCAGLGLAVAQIEPVAADPTIELGDRISIEINQPCMSPEEAAQATVALLDEMGFEGWSVVLEGTDQCGLVVFGTGDDHTLYVRQRPSSG